MASIQAQIEAELATSEPDVDVLLAEVAPGGALRIFIDHPEGVTLDLCERVTRRLDALRERYALEVSSPGIERPLTKPEHFRRYLGRRACIRTRATFAPGAVRSEAAGRGEARRRSFTGELVGATDSAVTLAAESGVVQIPYADINRSNLVEE